MTCPECGLYPTIRSDYLCRRCRNTIDGLTVCDYCCETYDPDAWKQLKWTESAGYAPRFAGLCRDCKELAGESTSPHFYTMEREAREAQA